jgi:hypothetical protein
MTIKHMTKPEREVAIHLAVRLGPACSPAVPLAAHSDVLLLQGATSGHSRSAVETVPWAPRRRPTAAGHGGQQLAGSVATRRREEADFRRNDAADGSQFSGAPAGTRSRPSAVARDGPVLGCASRSRSPTSE